MSLQDKVILITGSTNGIGRAIADRCAAAGALLVLNYRSDSATAEAMVQSLGADRAIAVQADASSLPDLDKLVDSAVNKFGRIDIVIPNAGLMLMRGVEDTTPEDFDIMMNMNVKGPYFLVQKCVPHMPSGGRVILVSTGICSATAVTPNYLLYATTKGAVEQMTRVMAKGLAAKGILVNAVAPGPTGTELFFKGKPEAVVEAIAKSSPFGRIGEPDEVASVFEFLCGDSSRWMSGQVVRVNGAAMV